MIHLTLKRLPGKALCAESDPEHWFPNDDDLWHPESTTSKESTAYAKAICGRCEVRTNCLQEAMNYGIYYGIWGGLTTKERKALRKKAGGMMTPERLAEIRQRDAAAGPWVDQRIPAFAPSGDRRELLAEVDRLRAEVAELDTELNLKARSNSRLAQQLVDAQRAYEAKP